MQGNGSNAANVLSTPNGMQQLQDTATNLPQSQQVQNALSQYGNGGMNLQQAMASAQAGGSDQSALMGDLSKIQMQGAATHGSGAFGNLGQQMQDQEAATAGLSPQQIQAMQAAGGPQAYAQQLGKQDAASMDPGALQNAFATNSGTANKYAQDVLGQNAQDQQLNKYQDAQMAQQPGLTAQLGQIQGALQGKSPLYNETPEDYAAYGQAAGNVTRQFGAMGNSLSQAMAQRGLGAAPSGQAAAQFSGLAGTQGEQLAGLQQQIAQNRINTATQMLQSAGNLAAQQQQMNQSGVQGVAGLQQNALQNQIGQQNIAKGQQQSDLGQSIGAQQTQQGMNQGQQNEQFAQQQASQGPGLGDVLGGVVGGALGKAAGAVGTGAGTSLSNSLFPSKTPTATQGT